MQASSSYIVLSLQTHLDAFFIKTAIWGLRDIRICFNVEEVGRKEKIQKELVWGSFSAGSSYSKLCRALQTKMSLLTEKKGAKPLAPQKGEAGRKEEIRSL